ncbi:MAG: helix-turn-helix domain-containing protein [Bryobacteraceae bacterium]
MCDYQWPGNVRELKNAVERAIVLAHGNLIADAEITLRQRSESPGTHWAQLAPAEDGWRANMDALEKTLIAKALRQADGNKSKAAQLLGIHCRLLYEKMRQHSIE